MPMIEGSSNVTISGSARLYEIHGNAVINHLTDTNELRKIQAIVSLPRAQASQKDYQTRKKSGPCYAGTRKALLQEMMDWTNEPGESRMYVLSGLAGIGKSTVAYTVATQADELGLLGASFFFSRDEDDRNNAKKVFTTIAFQLCVYDETFAKAIGDVLLTERGSVATTQNPQEQLQVLIVDPLRSIAQARARQILIVVDALDECDEDDERGVIEGLRRLVQDLPSFKVILTTRYVDNVLCSQKTSQLQNIEDKIVDGDIRLYLQHSLSLEEIQRRYPRQQWCASDEEIDSLVHAAGRLFIIASTAVRYIFDKSASNPAAQMKKLLHAFTQAYTPFKELDTFYTIILRNVVPANCDDDDIVNRYQSVVGAIIFVQRPLPVSTLAHLINRDVGDIDAVLHHLQSVILLPVDGDDVPRIYHKSFPDYLMDQARCKDPRLRIEPMIRHTQIATRCLEIMVKHLKRNILGLGDPARFMNNEDGLKEGGITEEQLQEKIPQQLRYACIYWVNHFELANLEDVDLMNGLEKFVTEHTLYWFEVLSLIENLDLAHRAIRAVLKVLKSRSPDLHQLLSDALRFISKFYEIIKRSALHTYYSALPFTPKDSVLYHRYIKDAADNICGIEGGPEKWDALVATLRHGEYVDVIKFSLDSDLFVSWSNGHKDTLIHNQGQLKIWDAATGTPISTISGHMFAAANDFSIVASFEDKTITFYNMNGSTRSAMLTTSLNIERLELSSKSSRVAAVLSDGTVWLWDSRSAKLIDSFNGFEMGRHGVIQFSPTGTRLAYSSANGIVKLRDGISGKFIADLRCGSSHNFEFSARDGSRIASVSRDCGLTLWNSENGALIGAVRALGSGWIPLAISANGSLLATANGKEVTLWSENNDSLAKIEVLKLKNVESMAFSLNNVLVLETELGFRFYDVKTHSHTRTLPFEGRAGAFSPDCTRFAVGDRDGSVNLWDIRDVNASSPPSEDYRPLEVTPVTALALSRDCSRLACGFIDGRVELWETSPMKRPIGPLTLRSKMKTNFTSIFRRSRHTDLVQALEFSPDGRLFASGSDDRTIKLWNGKQGSLRETLEAPSGRGVKAVALSNTMLVAGHVNGDVTVWSLDTLKLIHTIRGSDSSKAITVHVSIAEDNALIAAIYSHQIIKIYTNTVQSVVSLLDTKLQIPVSDDNIRTMTFLPDNSQLVVQSLNDGYLSLDIMKKQITKGVPLKDLIQLPNTSLWYGIPVRHCRNKNQDYISALFSRDNPVPVLWISRDFLLTGCTQGSSMIALGFMDGRVILLRPTTSHVG